MGYPKNRKLKPFGLAETPFNPMAGKRFGLGDVTGDIVVMEIVGINHASDDNSEAYYDTILCRRLDRIGDDDTAIRVYKPWLFRRSPFDGQTISEIEYDYNSNYVREACGEVDGVEVEEVQYVTPPYLLGEQILALRVQENWIDLNNAGRCWAVALDEDGED